LLQLVEEVQEKNARIKSYPTDTKSKWGEEKGKRAVVIKNIDEGWKEIRPGK